MPIYKDIHLIHQYSFTRQCLQVLRRKYGINKGQFEILCASYSLQTSKQPYFIVPHLIERLDNLPRIKVYQYIHELEDLGHIKLTLKTTNRNTANYYCVTGAGENILRRYITEINNLNVRFQY